MEAREIAQNIKHIVAAITVFFILFILSGIPAFGHGPKGHETYEFNNLEALQKGLMLYNKLIEKGKLHESWEIGLADVQVYIRKKSEKDEIVVRFNRTEGEPKSVYIFFNANGEYSGSNFSGE